MSVNITIKTDKKMKKTNVFYYFHGFNNKIEK